MKFSWKKLLSFALAVVLLGALLPSFAVPQAAAEELPESGSASTVLPELVATYDAESGQVTASALPQNAVRLILAGYQKGKLVFSKVEDDLSAVSVVLSVSANTEFDTLKVFCMDEDNTPVTEVCVILNDEDPIILDSVNNLQDLNNGDISDSVHYDASGDIRNIDATFSNIVVEDGEDAIRALHSTKNILNIEDPDEEFQCTKENHTEYLDSYRLDQQYQGIPVYGRGVWVVTNVDGAPEYLNSSYLDDIDVDINPALSKEEILNLCQTISDSYTYSVDGLVVESLGEYVASPRLAYSVSVSSEGEQLLKTMIMDASSGELLKEYAQTTGASQTGIGTNELGQTKSFPIEVSEFFGTVTYKLKDTERNIVVQNNGKNIENESNIWLDPSVVSAYTNTIKAYDWYDQTFGHKGIDKSSKNITVNVHATSFLDDGTLEKDNAYSNYFERTLSFLDNSDPNLDTTYASCLDVVVHEYTHAAFKAVIGVSIFNKFPYQNATGAIDEAYADIMACLMTQDWVLAEERRTIRDISDPGAFDRPSLYLCDLKWRAFVENPDASTNDRGGVHYNGVVLSNAFYQMYQNYISMERLAQLAYTSMNCGYDAESTFYTFRLNVIKAAELLGFTDAEIRMIENIFDDKNVTSKSERDVTGSIAGYAVNAIDGSAIPATINVFGFRRGISWDCSASINDGAFVVDYLPSDYYGVYIYADDYQTIDGEVEYDFTTSLFSDEQYLLGTLKFVPREIDLCGTLTDQLSNPIKNSTVSLYVKSKNGYQLKAGFDTKTDGKFSFVVNPLAQYKLVAETSNGKAEKVVDIKIEAIKSNTYDTGELRIAANVGLAVTHSEYGDVLAKGTVEFCNCVGVAHWTVTGAKSITKSGNWFNISVADKGDGSQELTISVTGYTLGKNTGSITFTAEDGKTQSVSVFQEAHKVKGTVTDGVDPISGASVVLTNNQGYRSAVYTTDADGKFAIPIYDGYHQITVTVDGEEKTVNAPVVRQNDVSVGTIVMSGGAATSGKCGDNLIWTLADGILTISGTGDMWDYGWNGKEELPPWGAGVNEEGQYVNRLVVTSVVIEDGVTSIGSEAFENCFALDSVSIPDTVKKIGRIAFCSSNLRTVHIPKSVTEIGRQAFSFCRQLEAFSVDAANPAYCDVEGVLFDKDMRTLYWYPAHKMGDTYAIPAGVERIEINAFVDAAYLTAIDIPASTTNIYQGQVFDGHNKLERINVDNRNTAFCDVDGVLFNKNKDKIISYPSERTADCYEVPSGVTVIGDNAFSGCWNLDEVILPEGLIEIQDTAFSGCGIRSITIPATVNAIGYYAISGWVEEVYFLGDVPSDWGDPWNPSFEVLPKDVKICYVAGKKGWTSPTWTAPDGVVYNTETFIPVEYSGKCGDNLTWTLDDSGVLIISGTGEMWDYDSDTPAPWIRACEECGGGVVAVIEDGVTRLGDYAFYRCAQVIIVPKSVCSVGCCALWATGQQGDSEAGVIFLGDVPEIWDNYALSPYNLIGYIDGTEGWSAPAWMAPDGSTYTSTAIPKEQWEEFAQLCAEYYGIVLPDP